MENIFDFIPFTFEWPIALLALPLPWLVKRKVNNTTLSIEAPKMPLFYTFKTLGIESGHIQETNQTWKLICLTVCWILLITALARPTYHGAAIDIPLNGRDLMLAIDISPSMKEQDLTLKGQNVTRLEVVKDVVSSFIDKRKGDRVGLILFGSEPYIQAPLTFDTTTVHILLDEAYLGMAGQATAIGDAIALGVKRLRNRPENSRVLILMSDGANTAGEIPPEKAAQLAAKENIKIYTIGIGADEMLKRTLFLTQRVNPSADLDEKMLTEIALTTGGEYFRARDTSSLENIYQQINKLEPIELDNKTYRPSKALYFWFLGGACFIYLSLFLYKTIEKFPIFSRLKHLINRRKSEIR